MPEKKNYRANVAAVIFNEKGYIWVGERIDIQSIHAWQMPQGGIDKNEDSKKAIIREIFEETGIKSIKIIDLIDDWIKYDLPKNIAKNKWNGKYIGQKQKWYLLYFYGNDKEININLSKNPEFKSWKWDTISNIIKNTVNFRKKVYKQVFDNFSKIINQHI